MNIKCKIKLYSGVTRVSSTWGKKSVMEVSSSKSWSRPCLGLDLGLMLLQEIKMVPLFSSCFGKKGWSPFEIFAEKKGGKKKKNCQSQFEKLPMEMWKTATKTKRYQLPFSKSWIMDKYFANHVFQAYHIFCDVMMMIKDKRLLLFILGMIFPLNL